MATSKKVSKKTASKSKGAASSKASDAKAVTKAVEHLHGFVSGINKVAKDQAKLNEKRVGTYTHGVLAAVACGSAETFTATIEGFMEDIRKNSDGIARKLGCVIAKRQPKGQPKNKPVYTVPSAVSALKSYMLSAYQYSVSLVEDDGGPRPYSQIRDEVNAVKQEEARKALTGDDKLRAEIVEAMDSIAENLAKTSGQPLEALHDLLAGALTLARESRKAEGKANKATATKLAKAA